MNSIKIELTIAGNKFAFAYDIPDAPGEISPTDLNERWLDEHLQGALRQVFGRPQPYTEPAPVVRVATKRQAMPGAL